MSIEEILRNRVKIVSEADDEDLNDAVIKELEALLEEEKTKARIDELENLQGAEMQLLLNPTINYRLKELKGE